MSFDTVIFIVSAVVAVFGATMMVVQRNPVASVLYLILSLVSQAVLYIQLGTVFMGAILVIVYAGAILVLFLFVIMLLNLRGREDLGRGSRPLNNVAKYVFAILLVVELVFAIRAGFFAETGAVAVFGAPVTVPETFGSVEQVAQLLFTRYLYPFELTAVLLLAAVVGAVVIARRDRESAPRSSGEIERSTSASPEKVEG